MIRLFEVRIETPQGRYLNVLVAARDEADARDIAVGMIEDFRGASRNVFAAAQAYATTSEVEVTAVTNSVAVEA